MGRIVYCAALAIGKKHRKTALNSNLELYAKLNKVVHEQRTDHMC